MDKERERERDGAKRKEKSHAKNACAVKLANGMRNFCSWGWKEGRNEKVKLITRREPREMVMNYISCYAVIRFFFPTRPFHCC